MVRISHNLDNITSSVSCSRGSFLLVSRQRRLERCKHPAERKDRLFR
jgi:hypothetical protein